MASIYGDTARGPMSPFFFDKFYEATDTLDPAGDEVMVGRYVLQRKSGAQPDEYSGVVYQKVYLNNEYSYTPIMTLTSPSISFGNVDYQWRDDASGRETYTQYKSEYPPTNAVTLSTEAGSTVTYTFKFLTEGLGEAIKQMWNIVGGTGTQVGTAEKYKQYERNLDTKYYEAGDSHITQLNYDEETLVGSINSLHKALGFLFKPAASTTEIINNSDIDCQYIYQVGTKYYIKLGNGFGGYVVKELTGNLDSLYGTLLYLWSFIGSDTDTSYDTIKGCINAFNNLFDGLTGITFAQGENNDVTIDMEANGVALANLKIQNTDGSNIINYVGEGREHTITINGGIGTEKPSLLSNKCSLRQITGVELPSLEAEYYEVTLASGFTPTVDIPQNCNIYYGVYNNTSHTFEDGFVKHHVKLYDPIHAGESARTKLWVKDDGTLLSYFSAHRNSTSIIIPFDPTIFGPTDTNYVIFNYGNSAMGYYTTCVNTFGQHVVGRYNETNSNALFQVGNGDESARNTAFEVLEDGSAKVQSVDSSDEHSVVTVGYVQSLTSVGGISKGSFVLNDVTYYYTVNNGIKFDIWGTLKNYYDTSSTVYYDSHAMDFPWNDAIGNKANVNYNSIGVQVTLDCTNETNNIYNYCGAQFGMVNTINQQLVYGTAIARYEDLQKDHPRSGGNTTYIKYNVHITGQFK